MNKLKTKNYSRHVRGFGVRSTDLNLAECEILPLRHPVFSVLFYIYKQLILLFTTYEYVYSLLSDAFIFTHKITLSR